jgi:acyl carrier protein
MNPQTTATLDRIGDLLITHFGVPAEEYRADAVLEDLDLDSLALVEFAMVVEKEFGIAVGDDEISPRDTVGDLARLLEDKAAAAGREAP